jgi:tRNA(Ile)-lysidine synthetase-like protein
VLAIPVPGRVALPGSDWWLESAYQPIGGAEACLTNSANSLQLRTRQPGDRFAPPGLAGHRQKLKKWLIDHKVPRNYRNQLPLIVADGEIAAFFVETRWIVSAVFLPENSFRNVIYLRFIEPESTQGN